MSVVAATARTFDAATRSGTLLLEDGTLVTYDASALGPTAVRLLRPGQRVQVRLAADGRTAVALTFPGLELPGADQPTGDA